jgi:hypothetical protein
MRAAGAAERSILANRCASTSGSSSTLRPGVARLTPASNSRNDRWTPASRALVPPRASSQLANKGGRITGSRQWGRSGTDIRTARVVQPGPA